MYCLRRDLNAKNTASFAEQRSDAKLYRETYESEHVGKHGENDTGPRETLT